jgi:hypothetical protein
VYFVRAVIVVDSHPEHSKFYQGAVTVGFMKRLREGKNLIDPDIRHPSNMTFDR